MIARTWHGAVPEEKADEYHEVLLRTGVADYKSTPGNQGVYVMRRIEGGLAHFLVLTLWDSWEAITAFAGDDADRARYYEEDMAHLVELESHVKHYEVLPSELDGTVL